MGGDGGNGGGELLLCGIGEGGGSIEVGRVGEESGGGGVKDSGAREGDGGEGICGGGGGRGQAADGDQPHAGASDSRNSEESHTETITVYVKQGNVIEQPQFMWEVPENISMVDIYTSNRTFRGIIGCRPTKHIGVVIQAMSDPIAS
ncbi:Hypothetical predicted protein [Olea europaea subsp. europaea]|uniref:Uncharacterized protein n=1 Tax=Olea europaea subsp. europaea TaxID=158383 RepID=A0A8S0SX82_OLEEU|nr:Hypothetical predicted protein [Olea europaea subsp. europaea]